MKKRVFCLLLASCLIASPAGAQDGAAQDGDAAAPADGEVKLGATLYSADGRRLGRIDRIRDGNAGVIYNGRFISIPLSSISPADKGAVTTLTRAQIERK